MGRAVSSQMKFVVADEVRQLLNRFLKGALEGKHTALVREVDIHTLTETEFLVYVKPQGNVGMRRCYKVKVSEVM